MATSVAAPLERQFGLISGVTEMTSSSTLGSTTIVLQFDLNRDIDGAARDVQAAINAARSYLPANLPSNPTYRKVNPAEAPILIIALTSDTVTVAQMYDAASSILAQKLSQVRGVGQVFVGGGSLPAVRVELKPPPLNRYGISLETVRAVLSSTSANRPKGQLSDETKTWEIETNDQLFRAEQYYPVYVAYDNSSGAGVRLTDVAGVEDSVEDVRTAGLVNGKPAAMVVVFRQPAANIIGTVDRVRAVLPQMAGSLPGGVNLSVVLDRTPPIRGSLLDVEFTLVLSAVLVILVVFAFLRSVRSTAVPGVAVAVSLVGTFGVMYLLGYSLDNLSLMALTIATGFVVDDAIVVLENITRHIEQGMPTHAGGLHRGEGDCLYGGIDEHLPRRGLHPDTPYGGHGGPPLPRVRRDPLHRRRYVPRHLAHHDADDVREAAEAAKDRAQEPRLPAERGDIQQDARHLRADAALVAAPPPRDALSDNHRRVPQHLPLHDHPQGVLPRAGHRAAPRHRPGRPGYLLPVDEGEADPGRRYHQGGPGRRERLRLYRGGERLARRNSADVRRPEAFQRAQGVGRWDHRAPAR